MECRQCRPKGNLVLYHGNLGGEHVQVDLCKNQIWQVIDEDELYITVKRNCFTLYMLKENFDNFFEVKQ